MSQHHALVSDTHSILYHAAGGSRLGPVGSAHFDACEEQKALLYIPAAVVWETSVLCRVGKVDLERSVRRFFDDLFSNSADQPLELTLDQIYLADEFRPNEDPFDALICAAARSLGLPLLSRDSAIEESDMDVVW